MLAIFLIVFCASQCIGQGSSQASLCEGPGRYNCGDGVCISRARLCNGVRDCRRGQDESDCDPAVCVRNDAWRRQNNYTCKRDCAKKRSCRGDLKKCICDDECGLSCINPSSVCEDEPPTVEHAMYRNIRRTHLTANGSKRLEIVDPVRAPYYLWDMVTYTCERGRRLVGSLPRCGGHRRWTSDVPECVDISCRNPVPNVWHTIYHRYLRQGNGRMLPVSNKTVPVLNDVVEYTCEDGLFLTGEPPKCVDNGMWSAHTLQCVVPCFENFDQELISKYDLTCGSSCLTTADCGTGMECFCDGPCSRVCVDPNITCREAPEVQYATVNYTGSAIREVARYSCDYGYYLAYGDLSLYCSGSGFWIGDEPICMPVQCGDPSTSIQETGGSIRSYDGTHVRAVIKFRCPVDYKMLGAIKRTCLGNGKWSGPLTICDLRDKEKRCPHPGVPIDGRLIGDDFSIGSTVRFRCDYGYVLYGDEKQTCLWMKEWSGTGIAPTCVDPRYPHTAGDVIGSLTRSLSNLPDQQTSLGRFISAEATEAQEIYFMFDVSQSVLKRPKNLKDEIEFAKRLVKRMEGFKGKIHFGIMVFASENVTALDISESKTRPKSIKQILGTLDRVYQEAASKKYKNQTRSGTATAYALSQLENMIAWMNITDENNKTKRHVFIFTDGKHTEGSNPVDKRKQMERQYKSNIEFYSITACKNCHVESHTELLGLSSGKNGENYIYIEDFYQLTSYLDKVTDVKLDFAKCGQAGNVGSIKQQASLARSTGGEDAAENAWPWQVLITGKLQTPELSLTDEQLIGGGSILNEKWILTAAHVLWKFYRNFRYPDWLEEFVLFVGIFNRPTMRNEKIRSTIKMYSIREYIPHEEYLNDESNIFENDIALIKIGPEFDSKMKAIGVDKLTFGYYIRPICLPCTRTCLKEEQLVDEDGISLINEGMNETQKCLKEEELLLKNDAKVVVTGFGHLNISKMPITRNTFNPPKNLQQALLQIEIKQTCEQGVEGIRIAEDLNNLKFSDNMICCKSGDPNKIIDACKGDSGGPVVREVKNVETGTSCWVQIGIVSFGYRCGSQYPGYYTNVARYIPWIQAKTEE
ncbi:complement factor B-like [Styela clava]